MLSGPASGHLCGLAGGAFVFVFADSPRLQIPRDEAARLHRILDFTKDVMGSVAESNFIGGEFEWTSERAFDCTTFGNESTSVLARLPLVWGLTEQAVSFFGDKPNGH